MRRRDVIRGEIERRGVTRLLHFTQAQNLPHIIDHGLLSRRNLIERGIRAYGSDRCRLDGEDEAVSVSISAVNLRMFHAKARRQGGAWIVLVLCPSVLWTLDCRFFARNAASRESIDAYGSPASTTAFLRMFEDRDPAGRHQGAGYRRALGIPDDFPTDPAAEVQVLQPIAQDYILGALVERRGLAEWVMAELDRLPGPERNVVFTSADH